RATASTTSWRGWTTAALPTAGRARSGQCQPTAAPSRSACCRTRSRRRSSLRRPNEDVGSAGEHPAQVDDHLTVDVLVLRLGARLDLAAELDFDLAIVLVGDPPERLEQRANLAPLDVLARRDGEQLLDDVPVIAVQARGGDERVDVEVLVIGHAVPP